MKPVFNILSQNNFFRHTLLRNIFFASLLVAIAFPLYTLYIVFPSFNQLLIEIYSDHSVRFANHLASMILPDSGEITRASISANASGDSQKTLKDFGLTTYKIFSPEGEIVFSTNSKDIGTINTNDYFQNFVAKGTVFSQMVEKDQLSLEGQVMHADVVETYVPVMRDNRFRGAFEIYFDITANKKLVDRLLSHSSAVIVMLALGLWSIIVTILIKENRSIHSRQLAEEALRESENRYRRILENMEDGYYETDRDGRITFLNESFCKIMGRSCDELSGKHLNTFTDQSDAEKGYQAFKNVLTTGLAVSEIELEIILKDGTRRPVSSSISLIRNTQEQAIGFRGIIRDITDRKRAVEEKLSFEKLQGVLETVGGICHELNQPMQVISGLGELLIMDLPKDHPYYDKIRSIYEQINRLGNITRKMMTITQYKTKRYAGGEKIIDIEKSSIT